MFIKKFVKIFFIEKIIICNTKSLVYLSCKSPLKNKKHFCMTNLKNLQLPLLITVAAATSLLVLSSWEFKNSNAIWTEEFCNQTDTLPKKESREKKTRDLDDVLDELNKVDISINMKKFRKN